MKHDMVVGHYSSSGYMRTNSGPLNSGPVITREEYEYKPPENDLVNKPAHYQYSNLQPVEVIRAWDLNFALGNVIKYICRSKRKNGLIDLEKALWYLRDEIEAQKTAKENEEDEEK
jgi:hypothetical protein